MRIPGAGDGGFRRGSGSWRAWLYGLARGDWSAELSSRNAVDIEHHLIVAREVTNQVVDRRQLPKMASKAKEALGFDTIEAIADAAIIAVRT